ncbi:hypothetical protein H2198_009399 [Neophaeococcomyces mojaviensis]|uniref:Uncharacterized protein n=1 Tax=Neophaeococcomyces mojaviensis TaxID=3383035 RepID=A0ACC2ZUI5_9EURO|nr:hypothetical protein H2198_009399 [Knufia sp. JES_112]
MCHDMSDIVVLDTGDIDSHNNLGINASPGDRLKYRRITTCAVLNSTSYVQGWNGTLTNSVGPRPAPETAYAYYGPSLNTKTDFTYSYSNYASFFTNFSAKVTNSYQIDVEQVFAPTEPAGTIDDFNPISELIQEQADLNLIFLSFTGMYLGQVNDPWFSAHNEYRFNNKLSFLEKRYSRDAAISVMGCTEQHNFCTGNNTCTGFLGFNQVQNVGAFNTALTPNQNATFDRLLRAVQASRLRRIVQYLSATTTPLKASNQSIAGNSGAVISQALPDNQWKLELEFWYFIAMAQLQRTVVQWATGQIAPDPQYVQYLLPPTDAQDHKVYTYLLASKRFVDDYQSKQS